MNAGFLPVQFCGMPVWHFHPCLPHPLLWCRLVVSAAAEVKPLREEAAQPDSDDALGVVDALGENLSLLRVFDDTSEILWSSGTRDLTLGAACSLGLGQVAALGEWEDAPGAGAAGGSPADPSGGVMVSDPCSFRMESDAEMLEFLREVLLDGEDAGGSLQEAPAVSARAAAEGPAACPQAATSACTALGAGFSEEPGSSGGDMFEPWVGGSLRALQMEPYPDCAESRQEAAGVLGAQHMAGGCGGDEATGRPAIDGGNSVGRSGLGQLPSARGSSEAQLLTEALELLPDLDAVAEQLCVKYDIVEAPFMEGESF